MFLFNPLDYILELEFFVYIFGAFGFLGVMLCLKKLIIKKG